ncbi:MAG TPA: hypothetical protein PLT70_09335, partial [bacterium]|nr:hypothetical protein [bacterium]
APKYNLLARKDEPIIWTVNSEPFKVDYDAYVTGSGEWMATGIESGKRYYFQFINTGPEGMLYNPKAVASWSSKEECVIEGADEDITDNETLGSIKHLVQIPHGKFDLNGKIFPYDKSLVLSDFILKTQMLKTTVYSTSLNHPRFLEIPV